MGKIKSNNKDDIIELSEYFITQAESLDFNIYPYRIDEEDVNYKLVTTIYGTIVYITLNYIDENYDFILNNSIAIISDYYINKKDLDIVILYKDKINKCKKIIDKKLDSLLKGKLSVYNKVDKYQKVKEKEEEIKKEKEILTKELLNILKQENYKMYSWKKINIDKIPEKEFKRENLRNFLLRQYQY